MSKLKKLKAFTLVEMLIVIVIIGVLAAAILPNLIGARNRANDVARVAALNKINASIQASIADTGLIPSGCGPLSVISEALGKAGMYDLPKDPNGNSSFFGIDSTEILSGQYGYCSIRANGSKDGAYVLMAKVEKAANANYVVGSGDNNYIDKDVSINEIMKCETFAESVSASEPDLLAGTIGSGTKAVCDYIDDAGQLRYIVIQS